MAFSFPGFTLSWPARLHSNSRLRWALSLNARSVNGEQVLPFVSEHPTTSSTNIQAQPSFLRVPRKLIIALFPLPTTKPPPPHPPPPPPPHPAVFLLSSLRKIFLDSRSRARTGPHQLQFLLSSFFFFPFDKIGEQIESSPSDLLWTGVE